MAMMRFMSPRCVMAGDFSGTPKKKKKKIGHQQEDRINDVLDDKEVMDQQHNSVYACVHDIPVYTGPGLSLYFLPPDSQTCRDDLRQNVLGRTMFALF